VQEYVTEFTKEIARIEEFYMRNLASLSEELKNIESQVSFKTFEENNPGQRQ
jgi:hypothetical protein